ncbi:hypothetical protein CYMTET_35298 [Cymbomonas tetramitiformis]|uniref:Uncharacterized protein n=1 Tax=Cymbomonas tetramitiformis TaxID=36881 RepID=A0AAE0F9D3_9CHLO|nr:hypothetical protein CYMTET_35298 [Cymbomonas tetramitiformis]
MAYVLSPLVTGAAGAADESKEEQPADKPGEEDALQNSSDEPPSNAKPPPEGADGTAKSAGRKEQKTGSARARLAGGQRRSSAPVRKVGEGSARSTHSTDSEPLRRTASRASTSAPTKQDQRCRMAEYLQTLRPKVVAPRPGAPTVSFDSDIKRWCKELFDVKKGVAVISTAGCKFDQEV